MEINQTVLEGIKSFAKNVQSTQVGQFLGRTVVHLKTHPIPAVAAAVALFAAFIFIILKYSNSKPNPPIKEKDVVEIILEEVLSDGSARDIPDEDSSSSGILGDESSSSSEDLGEGSNNSEPNAGIEPNADIKSTADIEPNADIEPTAKPVNPNISTKSKTKKNQLNQPKPVDLSVSAIQRKFLMSSRAPSDLPLTSERIMSASQMKRELTNQDLCQNTLQIVSQNQAAELSKGSIETVSDALTLHIGGKLAAIHQTAKAMEKVLVVANQHGTHLATAGFSILFGLGQFFSGNFVYGTAGIVAGAKELYDIKASFDKNLEIDKVFEDLNDNFDVIRQLGNQNQGTLDKIDGHLNGANDQIVKLQNVFHDLKEIVDHGNHELRSLKSKTQESYDLAIQKQEAGVTLLEKSKSETAAAKKSFEACWSNIQQISKFGEKKLDGSEDANQAIKSFSELAEGLKDLFEVGMKSFNQSQKLLEDGLNLLKEADHLNFDVRLNMVIMNTTTQQILNDVKLKAENQEALDILQNVHIHEIKNLTDQVRLAEDEIVTQVQLAQGNVDEVKQIFEAMVNRQLVCAGVAATFAALIAGPVVAGIAAVTTPKLIEEGTKYFTPVTDLLTNYVPPENAGDVSMGFYTQSTGHFHILKGSSTTAGVISIHVGDGIKNYPFNLNEKNHGINVASLAKDLSDAIDRNVLTPQECLNVLEMLADPFDRVPYMLINTHSAFDDLNAKCGKKNSLYDSFMIV